jgi:SAM-dependent methyltransferase
MRIALALLLSVGTGLDARMSLFPAPLNAAAVVARQAPARTPDVHFVPTPTAVVDGMLKLADVKASDVVYDLGSGDGRIVIAAAQKFGARGVGIELDRRLVSEANKKARKAGVADKVTFLSTDLFTADISEATVVTLYLLPSINLRLQPKLMRELKPGTRICLAQVRHGRLEAGTGTDGPRCAPVPLDNSFQGSPGSGLNAGGGTRRFEAA